MTEENPDRMAANEEPRKGNDVVLRVPDGLEMEDRDPDDINSHVKVRNILFRAKCL